jgi:SAM-dependent methyltransferase
MQNVLDKHYRRLAKDYDEFLYYSDEFVRALTTKMIDKLQLAPNDVLADIGCGTAMYSLDILKQVRLENPIIGVDPYAEMLACIPPESLIAPIAEDALTFSRRDVRFDKVLVKETIHHVDRREEFFANIHARLPSGGKLLLVHVPPDVKYPLFDAALERCLRWHADPNRLAEQLAAAGFTVARDSLDYRHVLPKQHYFQMVRSCYMSVLTSFDASEIEAGLAEMADRYANDDPLIFVDHFDFLTATKP